MPLCGQQNPQNFLFRTGVSDKKWSERVETQLQFLNHWQVESDSAV